MAIAFGAQAVNATPGTSASTHTATLALSAGDLVLVSVASRDTFGASTITTCTGTVNATYTMAGTQGYNAGAGNSAIFYFANSASGTETVTVSFSGSVRAEVNISRWTGAATASVLDQSNNGSNGSVTAGNPHTFGSITTTGTGVIACAMAFGAGSGTETQTGFTELTPAATRGYFSYQLAGVTTTDGSLTSSVTSSSAGSIANFLEAGGSLSETTRYNSFAEDMADGTIDLDNDTFKVCLVTSSYTPSLTHTQLSDVSANRVSGTTDVALTSVTWARSGGTATFDAADTDSLFSSTGTPKYAVIYSDTSTNDKLVGYVTLPDSTTITSGDTLRLVWDAAGIFTLA
jgi:hypothetical protein